MALIVQINQEKRQSIITLRHEGLSKSQELRKLLQVQSQKPSSAMMKLALMRTATGKEDSELTLLQRISSLELTAPQTAAQINGSQSSSNRLLNSNCSEEIRPSWSNCCKETITKGHQQEEETCLGKETRAMDIRPDGNLSFGLMSPKLRFLVPTAVIL